MRLDVYLHLAGADEVLALLTDISAGITTLKKGQKAIMVTQASQAARLADLGTKLDKISEETTSLVEAVRDLKEKAGEADPALVAAIDDVLGKADAIDAKVDDLAPNPTPTPPVEEPGEGGEGGEGTGGEGGEGGPGGEGNPNP